MSFKWEMMDADSGHKDNLYRVRVPFGWLVKCVSYQKYQEKKSGLDDSSFNMTSSITYVFDPFKKWFP